MNNSGNINEAQGKSWLPKFLADMFDSSAAPAQKVQPGVNTNIALKLNNNAPSFLPKMLTNVLKNEPAARRTLRANAPNFVPAGAPAAGLRANAAEFVPAAAPAMALPGAIGAPAMPGAPLARQPANSVGGRRRTLGGRRKARRSVRKDRKRRSTRRRR